MAKRVKGEHYVNNREFHELFVAYKKQIIEAEESGKEKPRLPNAIAIIFMKIATRYASKSNYTNYPFKDEMIADAVLTCIRYADKYNPDKYDNPFAYFTTTCKNAFLQRIEIEHKELYNRIKIAQRMDISGELADTQDGDNLTYAVATSENDFTNEFVANYERKVATRKEKARLSAEERKRLSEEDYE